MIGSSTELEKIVENKAPNNAPAIYAMIYRIPRALSNFISLTFPSINARVMHGLKWDPEILPENIIVTNIPKRRPALSAMAIPSTESGF